VNNLAEVASRLFSARRLLICGHIMPDGDCLGSVLALGMALEQLGKEVTMAGPDPVPSIYRFLPSSERFLVGKLPENNFDTIVVLDCSVPERLGDSYRVMVEGGATVVVIDHHQGPVSFGTCRYIDVKASAVGEILYDLFKIMNIGIDTDIATCLYTAIVTDTGSLRYDNVSPGTHRKIAELLETGLPAATINTLIYEEKPKEAVFLLGAALKTLSISDCGRVSWMNVTREMLERVGARDEHAEGLINYTRSIKGVEIGLLFHEMVDGRWKVSFRSKSLVDVSKLAAVFGGGGHRRAAGCVMRGQAESIRREVITAALAAIREAGE